MSGTREHDNSTVGPCRWSTQELNETCLRLFANESLPPSLLPCRDEKMASPNANFYIGLGLAISSSVFIGSSFILKKRALIRLASRDPGMRAGSGGHGYLYDWMWWSGIITMGVGEGCNFAAYAFAPATLVTPLGALSVLVSAVLASRYLDERLNLIGKVGCFICTLGAIMIILHAPKEDPVNTMPELEFMLQAPGFIFYVVFVASTSLLLVFYAAPRWGTSNILVYLLICSVIGSLSVVGIKGIGLAITQTIGGVSQVGNWLTWFFVIQVILCVSVQLNYLNKSLDLFNTSMVTPVYYVFFTIFVIIGSVILFQEWNRLTIADILGNLVGFITTVVGIFQMQVFRNVPLNMRHVLAMLRQQKYTPESSLCSGVVGNNNNSTTRNSSVDPLLPPEDPESPGYGAAVSRPANFGPENNNNIYPDNFFGNPEVDNFLKRGDLMNSPPGFSQEQQVSRTQSLYEHPQESRGRLTDPPSRGRLTDPPSRGRLTDPLRSVHGLEGQRSV